MDTTTLAHVNTPPAQTWNYLRVNDIALDVPTPTAPAEKYDGALADLEMGAGDAATAWIDATAAERTVVEVAAGDSATVAIDLTDDDPAHATDVTVAAGGHVSIAVTSSVTRQDMPGSSALRIRAERGASVELVTVVACADDARTLDSTGVELADGATLDARQYVLGGRTSIVGLAVNQAGERSRFSLSTRYLVRAGQTLDVNYVSRMRGRDTRCDIDVSGVLEQGATKSLRDTIDLIHGAKGAKGRENETVLLAGDDVVNKSLPVILCDEDDVQGDHGATIGSISPEQMAYLADRGLTEADATALFSRAVVDDAYAHATPAARTAIAGRAAAIYGDDVAEELACEHATED